jgi:3D (Asp-Asp-Asp) domain-containing protein
MLSNSLWRKLIVMAAAIAAFLVFHETRVLDSKYAARQAAQQGAAAVPAPDAPLLFRATAYCTSGLTASGVAVRTGIAAADPRLLPVGSVVRLDVAQSQYSGIYTIMDTGAFVKGRHVDLFIRDCDEATRFGRSSAHVKVLRLGWKPN